MTNTAHQANVLHEYPPEILSQIFFFLLELDVIELVDPPLSAFYLQCKHRNKDLDALKSSAGSPLPHNINSITLQLFLQVNKWFRPVNLAFTKATSLQGVPRETLERFRSIYQLDSYRLDKEDYEEISYLDNIKNLSLDLEMTDLPRLPKNLQKLDLLEYNGTAPIVAPLKELDIHGGMISNLSLLPSTLTRLHMCELLGVNLADKLPLNLVDLDIADIPIEFVVDFLYLKQLRVFSIEESLDNIVLPNTLTSLKCWDSGKCSNYNNYPQLTILEICNSNCHGVWHFPNSLTQLKYFNCFLHDVAFVENTIVQKFELCKTFHCSSSGLNLRYPSSLTLLIIKEITILRTSPERKKDTQIIKFDHLPDNLKEFHFLYHRESIGEDFSFPEKVRFDTTTRWPNSVHKILLHDIGGFQNGDLQAHSCLTGAKWPLELRELSIICKSLKIIRDTNLGDAKNLCLLNLDSEVTVLDQVANQALNPRHTIFRNALCYQSCSRLVSVRFEKVTVSISREWLLQIPKVKNLEFNSCVIATPKPFNLPLTVRELVLEKCDLTSDQWSMFSCPVGLEVLNLIDNSLTLFDVSTINQKLRYLLLRGNNVKPWFIPYWKEVCGKEHTLVIGNWKFNGYTKIDELGGAYTIQKYRNGVADRTVTIAVIPRLLIVYEGNKTGYVPINDNPFRISNLDTPLGRF